MRQDSDAILTNRDRADAFMDDARVDAIVGASQANVYYLSGYRCWLEPLMRDWMIRPGASSRPAQESFAVLTREGGVHLVVGATFVADAISTWATDIRCWGTVAYDADLPRRPAASDIARYHDAQRSPSGQDAVEALVATLRAVGLADSRVGIDREGMHDEAVASLRRALPRADFRDCSWLMRLVRMVKGARELRALSSAAAINECSGVSAARMARPGLSTGALARSFRVAVATAGAEFDHCVAAVDGFALSSYADHELAADSIFAFDYGCNVDGYFADAGVTVALRDMPDVSARYKLLREAICEVGLRAMRPGMPASSVHGAMDNFLRNHHVTSCFPHGHGLGLELRDLPILVPDMGRRIKDECVDVSSDIPLECGMVVNLEATIFAPGTAGVEVEITALVGEEEATPLVPQRREEPISPAVEAVEPRVL
jgi:Xaa-Pro aminopeptidase